MPDIIETPIPSYELITDDANSINSTIIGINYYRVRVMEHFSWQNAVIG